jgi:molecular chaperone HscB
LPSARPRRIAKKSSNSSKPMSSPTQLAPAATNDYFSVFALPRKLSIDVSTLEKQFYRLSRKLHPDLHAQASAEQQAAMLAQSSQLNDAYRTLKNPVTRVEYLLELLGVRINENNASKKTDAPRVPADLLEEVFELNMQLEEMRANSKMGEDDPELRADLERARTQFTDQLAAVDSDLQQRGSAWDSALDREDESGKTAIGKELAALLDRRGYLRNLVRDVNETLEAK